ncbi:MAG: hypothetical protein ACR2QM_09935 [Longimicrobiales bacterium]
MTQTTTAPTAPAVTTINRRLTNDAWDCARQLLLSGEVRDGMDLISKALNHVRASATEEVWHLAIEEYRSHPVFELVREAPITRRALDKPRGYAGDAVTLDYIYGMAARPDGCSTLGSAMYGWERETRAARAVRGRMELAGALLNDLARRIQGPMAVSVACGHLREASRLEHWKEAQGQLVAMDKDILSLGVVHNSYGHLGVLPERKDPRGLLREIPYRNVDLVYSTGLYDYLSPRWAKALTQALFKMVRPGGRVWIANFREFPAVGYMEGSMGWWLRYRTESDMESLVEAIPDKEIGKLQVTTDETGTLVFLEITRA